MILTQDDLQAIANLLEPQFGLIGQKFDEVDQRFEAMDQRLDTMDQRLGSIENRLDKVESEVSSLKVGQLEMRKDIKKVYDLALDAWGTSQENRNWLETAHI